jgi:hypothetical protein
MVVRKKRMMNIASVMIRTFAMGLLQCLQLEEFSPSSWPRGRFSLLLLGGFNGSKQSTIISIYFYFYEKGLK